MSETVFAAYMCHAKLDIPDELTDSLSAISLRRLYYILRINKALMKAMSGEHLKNSKLKKCIINYLEKKDLFRNAHILMENITNELLSIINLLNTNGVEAIFIKSVNSLPLDSDNYDVLIKDCDLKKTIEILLREGFVKVIRVKEPYKLLFRKVKDGKDYVAVHLHTRVAWEGIDFLNTNDLWRNYRKIKISKYLVGVPSYEDCLLITFAHLFFENHNFKLGDLALITEIFGYHKNVNWTYIIDSVKKYNWAFPFCVVLTLSNKLHLHLYNQNLISENVVNDVIIRCGVDRKKVESIVKRILNRFDQKKELPLKIPLKFVFQHYLLKILRDKATIRTKIGKIFSITTGSIVRRVFGEKKGFNQLICFIGVDGSGKTTHATRLEKELVKREIRSKYCWTRGVPLFFQPLTSFAKKLVGMDELDLNKENVESRRKLLREPYQTLSAVVLLLDHILQIIFKVKIPMMLGSTVICDRYIYDTFIDIDLMVGKNYEGTIVEKFFRKVAPKPSIVFITDCDLDVILKRRPNQSFREFLKMKRQRYLNLSSNRIFFVLDTSRSIDENAKIVLSMVLEKYYSGKHSW